jgi:hypothetical protein
MNHASTVLRYERRLSRHKRIRHRSGSDNSPGSDYPECRSFFQVNVGPDEQMEDAWSVNPKEVSSDELQKNVTQRFHEVDAKLHETMETLHHSVDVRYKRLDAKLNTLFKMIKSSMGSPNPPSPLHHSHRQTARTSVDDGLAVGSVDVGSMRIGGQALSQSRTDPMTKSPRGGGGGGGGRGGGRGSGGGGVAGVGGAVSVEGAKPPADDEMVSVQKLTQAKEIGTRSNSEGSRAGHVMSAARSDTGRCHRGTGVHGEEVKSLRGGVNLKALPKDFVANLFQRCDTFATGFITREQMCWIIIQVLAEIGADEAAVADPGTEVEVRALIATKPGNGSVSIRELANALQIWIPEWRSAGVHGLRRLSSDFAHGAPRAWYDSGPAGHRGGAFERNLAARASAQPPNTRLVSPEAERAPETRASTIGLQSVDRSFDHKSTASSVSSGGGLHRTGRQQARDLLRPLPGASRGLFPPSSNRDKA